MGWRTSGRTWRALRPLARRMRAESTDAEDLLWQKLRCGQLGVRFRRFVIDRFVADFYCSDPPIVVEVDGSAHMARGPRDAERDRRLAAMGVVVIRLRNEEVTGDLDAAVARVRAALDARVTR